MSWLFWIFVVLLIPSTAVPTDRNGRQKNPLSIFLDYGCEKCHTITSLGIVRPESEEEIDEEIDGEEADLPPDLSTVGNRYDAEWISLYLRKKTDIEGRKHKKRFKGKKEERRILAEWLAGLRNPEAEEADNSEENTELFKEK